MHFLLLSNNEGPLINTTKSTSTDVWNFCKVFCISIGFVFAMYFNNLVGSIMVTFLSAFENEVLNELNTWLVVIYSVIGFVLLFNLLIAMMAESY